MAYGERHTLEACARTIAKTKDPGNVEALTMIARLYGTECVRRDLGFYLVHKAVGMQAAKNTGPVMIELINYMAA